MPSTHFPAAETEGFCHSGGVFLSTHNSDAHGLQTVVFQQASQSTGVLNMMHRLCSSGQMLAYGWGRNAPPLTLPPGVGFEIGAGSGFTHAVLEVCFVYGPCCACACECSHGIFVPRIYIDPLSASSCKYRRGWRLRDGLIRGHHAYHHGAGG